MANTLNPQLIMGAVGDSVPLNDLGSIYNNAINYRVHKANLDKIDEQNRYNDSVRKAYAASVGEDGQIDQNKLQANLAQGMAGDAIPGVLKSFSAVGKERADIAKAQADTGKTIHETLLSGLKATDNSIAALASNPNTTDRDVYGEMGRLVNAGAFDVQAKEKNMSPDQYARDLLSTMPVGNPQALRGWLIQAGSRVADASKRLELMLPKYDEQDRGGVINQGTIDQMTGQRTAGQNVAKTNTPGELLSAETTRRGQDMTDRRAKQFNDITQEAANSQVVESPQGYAVINKGTANARPVAVGDQPLLGKDSQVAKNAGMADRLSQILPMARQMLQEGPTASGAGAATDKMLSYLGYSTKGADKAMALEALGGWLTSNVPRMEGPQSDADTLMYRTMAARVGDRTLPVSTRIEAANIVEQIAKKYSGQRDLTFSGPPGTAPATTIAPRPATPTRYTGPDRRQASPAGGQPQQRPHIDSFFMQGGQ